MSKENKELVYKGKLYWKDALEQGLYSESLMVNKNVDVSVKEGTQCIERMSFKRASAIFDCIFDTEFVLYKLSIFFNRYCQGMAREDVLDFCAKALDYKKQQELSSVIKQLVATKGNTYEYWEKKLSDI